MRRFILAATILLSVACGKENPTIDEILLPAPMHSEYACGEFSFSNGVKIAIDAPEEERKKIELALSNDGIVGKESAKKEIKLLTFFFLFDILKVNQIDDF